MDINIESQIVVQTSAQWAADTTVYSAKRILITSDAFFGATDQRKFKIADGNQTWSNLDYFPVSGYDDATSSIQTQLNGKQASGSYLTSANIVETITNGVTDKAPSENAVFDALALKQSVVSGVDDTEIGYLNGVTSSIQTQLNGKVYAVDFGNITNWSIADLTTYYMGLSTSVGTTTDQISFVPLYAGTIVAIITEVFSAGTVGSNTEDGTLTLFYNGGGSSTVIASDFKMGANRHFQRNFTGLSISIPTGAAYLKFDAPSYSTNPTAIQLRVTLLIRP